MLASLSVKEFRLRIQEHRPITGAKAPKVRNENAGNGSPPQEIAPALFYAGFFWGRSLSSTNIKQNKTTIEASIKPTNV